MEQGLLLFFFLLVVALLVVAAKTLAGAESIGRIAHAIEDYGNPAQYLITAR